ncbi:MAG: bifunctional phosphopantothenoylcysteine decarboxylase/phosphopantothenate--cysteine ligase CoaBC [Eubacterium sp.]|nr:bifunctional phosphopantothenoylcysteine decarboxylase/phosphopantothenate--cysteine ligase CoaBC [Eubacterium sp.]
MLKGKNILLGISGGIAAYKMADVASSLTKLGADVHVVMTENATKLITPEVFRVLTKNKVYTDVFDDDPDDEVMVPHISLGTGADLILIAPATANVIGKLANGIADDMLTTTVLPARCPIYIAPSMNVYMLENPVVQKNIEKLRALGYNIIEPATGYLACGYEGKGKLPSPELLVETVSLAVSHEKDMEGLKVLVNAGPTQESLDPVRIITNHSSGKMGYAIARQAARRGADVTLVSGPVNLAVPLGVNVVNVVSAADMYEEMTKYAAESDIMIMSAAVADYTPAVTAENKIKKSDGGLNIEMVRTKDILKTLGEAKKEGQFICGFSMETENMIENSRKKLDSKNADMICANNLKVPGTGFKVDTNIITLITADEVKELPLMSKEEAADEILTKIISLRQ